MEIQWLGHAAFFITLENGTRILTDPYEAGFRDLIRYGPIEVVADVVTVSHEHGDHNHVAGLSGSPQVVRGPGVQAAGGLTFEGFASFHDPVEGRERGPNTIFCFEAEGLRVCHLGDLGHALDEESAAALGRVDVLFIPTGGPRATLGLEEARQVCRRLRPVITIPMHFKNEKCSFPAHGVEDFMAGEPGVRRLNRSRVQVSRQTLPPEAETWVFDPAL